jgi:hypothetical protein
MLAGVRESMMERFMPLVAEAHRLQLRAYLHQALSPSGITAAATREAQLWFALSGYELDENQPLNLEKDSIGPYGAGTIPSKLAIRVMRANAAGQEAVVSYRQDFDTAALPDMVLGLAPGLRAKDDTRIEMYDEAQYVVDLRSNRVKAMTHVRTIEVEGTRRGDSTEMRLLE